MKLILEVLKIFKISGNFEQWNKFFKVIKILKIQLIISGYFYGKDWVFSSGRNRCHYRHYFPEETTDKGPTQVDAETGTFLKTYQ